MKLNLLSHHKYPKIHCIKIVDYLAIIVFRNGTIRVVST